MDKKICFQGQLAKEKTDLKYSIRPYLSIAGELTIENNLLMRRNIIIIETGVNKAHVEHQGITKC